jgi:hypothetical protein
MKEKVLEYITETEERLFEQIDSLPMTMFPGNTKQQIRDEWRSRFASVRLVIADFGGNGDRKREGEDHA